ncbi:MAG: cell division protein ZipA C-terminal FtsZ-binding domain-containing protein [Halomonas sp.]|nr:cell division protein ZipA C-terminal FtsZ-binding domain-containing protein [Halomonas sp.]MDP3534591.1 cell division protein ZipA C-terminal FtsZ-binding domain-containing protein [Halomonas sp.]
MDTTALTLVIAIAAIWFSLNCGLLVVYMLLKGDAVGGSSLVSQRSAPLNEEHANPETPVLVDENASAWGLFVMFDDPTIASNERLSSVLTSSGAVYESSSRTFTLAGDSPRNPLLISNAYPPGTLPSFNQDNGDFPVKGVTVKMMKTSPNATPNKLQLVRLVKLAKELARIGGKVVDAEKQPITEAGFKAVIAGKAKV